MSAKPAVVVVAVPEGERPVVPEGHGAFRVFPSGNEADRALAEAFDAVAAIAKERGLLGVIFIASTVHRVAEGGVQQVVSIDAAGATEVVDRMVQGYLHPSVSMPAVVPGAGVVS